MTNAVISRTVSSMFGNLLTAEQKTMLTGFYTELKDSLTPKQREMFDQFWSKLKPTLTSVQSKMIVDPLIEALKGK